MKSYQKNDKKKSLKSTDYYFIKNTTNQSSQREILQADFRAPLLLSKTRQDLQSITDSI